MFGFFNVNGVVDFNTPETIPSTPKLQILMSSLISSNSRSVYTKSPPRGLINTKTFMSARKIFFVDLGLGVVPASHNQLNSRDGLLPLCIDYRLQRLAQISIWYEGSLFIHFRIYGIMI